MLPVLEAVKTCAFLVEVISIRNCVAAQLSRYLLDPFENSSNIQSRKDGRTDFPPQVVFLLIQPQDKKLHKNAK